MKTGPLKQDTQEE